MKHLDLENLLTPTQTAQDCIFLDIRIRKADSKCCQSVSFFEMATKTLKMSFRSLKHTRLNSRDYRTTARLSTSLVSDGVAGSGNLYRYKKEGNKKNLTDVVKSLETQKSTYICPFS